MRRSWVARLCSGQSGPTGLPNTFSSDIPTLDVRVSRLNAQLRRILQLHRM